MKDTDQNSVQSEPAIENDSGIKKKKRSPVERAVVWGVISAFLIVILIEGNARYGFSSTLAELQNRIGQQDNGKGQEFLLVEAKEMVKGFPYGEERLTKRGKQLQYRWFSLFRTFALQLSMDNDDVILSLSTDAEPFTDENIESKSPKIALHQQSLPETGLSKEDENVAVLTTDQLGSQSLEFKGILTREIIRQALLISAREGLGLKTRDASLRGDVLLIENPETFPLELIAEISSLGEVNIQLSRPRKNQLPFHWDSEPFTLPRELGFELLIENTEEISRKGFVDALKSAGYTGNPPEWVKESTVSDKLLEQLKEWNFVSQYSVIQKMHKEISKEGESPERLAVLARAYANLGSLTEFLWSPAHKVFKARALLYAERLTTRTDDSPWALAHRAYVRSFVGRHRTALIDIETIRSAKSENEANTRPIPVWIDLIDAYCSYKPEVLDKAVENEETRHLAVYLNCLLADPASNEKQMLAKTEQLLELEPACCRAMDRLCEVGSLGIKRMVTEQRFDEKLWPAVYEKLREANISNSVNMLISMEIPSRSGLGSEQQARMQIIRMVKDSNDSESEPSLMVLGQLLQEISFIQITRKLEVLTRNLSLEADDVLPGYRLLVQGHPYEQYIESFSSDKIAAKAAYEKLLNSYDPHELEITALDLISNSYYKLGAQAYHRLFTEAVKNIDFVYQDQLQHARWYNRQNFESNKENYFHINNILIRISPHMPRAVAMKIKADQEYMEKQNVELMEKYGNNSVVLAAITDRHLANHDDDKAEEVLKRRMAINPDHKTFSTLADIYKRRGEIDEWKKLLEKSLDLPSLGLENAFVHNKLAEYHMEQGEWELAKPHAVKAAMTYSGWGLVSAGKCYEGLGDLQQAEAFVRACSLRYQSSAADWYFWCVRTDYGDIESARRLIEKHLLANPTKINESEAMQVGVYQLTQGLKSQAFDSFLTAFQNYKNTYCGLHAALLADELGHEDQRDELLIQVSKDWSKESGMSELANFFQRMLQKPESVEWNPNWFQSQLAQLSDGSSTNFYYFAGKFLELRGQNKWATIYLQLAATSPITNKYNCTLAAQHLRSQKKQVNASRTTVLNEGYDQAKRLAQKAFYLIQSKKQKEAIKIYDEILKLKPELVIILINRGQIHEALENYSAAIADYKKAIELEPEYWLPHNNLAFLLAVCERAEHRDGSQSLKHAQQAFKLLPTKYWVNYSALAVAYAETGQFEKAIEMQNQALELAPKSQQTESARRVRLYQKGEPYRRSSKKE